MDAQNQSSDAGGAIGEESTASICWSSRLASANKNAINVYPSINEWTVPRLLEALCKSNIMVPSRASHEELYELFMANVHIEPPAADLCKSFVK